MASSFAELQLSPGLLETVAELGYEEPTPIQEQTIPPLIAGRDLQDRPIVACRGTSQQLACDFDFDARLLAPREERDDPAAAGLTNQLTRFRILPTKPSVIVDHPCGDANRIERLLDIAAEPGIGVSIGDGCYLAVRAECIDENFESFGLGCGLDIT